MNKRQKAYCNCCGECCKHLDETFGVLLAPDDITNISKRFCVNKSEFIKKYCIMEDVDTAMGVKKLYFIKAENAICPFLSEENLCSIHLFQPIQCRELPPLESFIKFKKNRQDYTCYDKIETCKQRKEVILSTDLLNSIL